MTDWFRRKSKNITTTNKRDTAEGLWHNCPKCSAVIYRAVLKENFFTCVPVLNGNSPVKTLFNASIDPSAEEIACEKYEPLVIILSIFGVTVVRFLP